MIGRKKSPKTEIGILNVRLHQIGIRGRIWTYQGYNFVIVSYVFALKKKQKKCHIYNNIYVSVSISVAAVCCLCISYKRTIQSLTLTPYVKGLTYVATYVYVRSLRSSTRHYLYTLYLGV